MIEKSVGEEGHNHQEKYFQFYENKRWLTAQTVPLCVELPKDFHFLLPIMPILQRQFFLLNSIYCQFFVRSRRGNMDSAENGFQWENKDTPFEEKSLLIDSLPEGFKHRVKKQKILEQSEIKEE